MNRFTIMTILAIFLTVTWHMHLAVGLFALHMQVPVPLFTAGAEISAITGVGWLAYRACRAFPHLHSATWGPA